MGFFSWKTSDTQESIANSYSSRPTFTVHMITEDGQVFTEECYDGYGEFGGKDIYELIAEMNGLKREDGEMRSQAISLLFETHIVSPDGKRRYKAGSAKDSDFFHWETPLKSEGGKTPNQLVKEGWKQEYPYGYGNFEIAAKNGLKLPKLVEELPDKKNWKKDWDALPYPENCEDQGYFYSDEDEEDEEE